MDLIVQQSRLSCLYAARIRVTDLYRLHTCIPQTNVDCLGTLDDAEWQLGIIILYVSITFDHLWVVQQYQQ